MGWESQPEERAEACATNGLSLSSRPASTPTHTSWVGKADLSAFFVLGSPASPLSLQLVPLTCYLFVGPEDEERRGLAGGEIWGVAWKPPLSLDRGTGAARGRP